MKNRNAYGWLIWCVMIFTYMLNTFHAVAMGAVRTDIIEEMHLTENQFVLLTNAFSYAYMIMQIPVGILLDTKGARKVACICNAIACAGAFVFSFSGTYAGLLIGRAMIGMGCSVCFLSILKICANWFDTKIFCTMSGLTTLVGMVGAVMAQTPLTVLNSMIGWRRIYQMIGFFSILLIILMLVIVKDSPEGAVKSKMHIPVGSAIKEILSNKYTWPPFIAYGCYYGTYLIMSGVYGSSMLTDRFQLSAVTASGYLTLAVVGCAIGGILVSTLSDRLHSRRMVQIVFGGIYLLFWGMFVLVYHFGGPSLLLPVVLFGIGLFSCAYSVVWSAVKEVNNPLYVGMSTSIGNVGGYLGSIVVPTAAGLVYSGSGSAAGGYSNVLTCTLVFTVIGLVASLAVKETGGENIWQKKVER